MILITKFLIPKKFIGLTVWPFILLKNKELRANKVLINHETIHLKQQLELLIIPFFIWYVLEYFFRLIQYRNSFTAYQHISFEREAYANERNIDYLKSRKMYSFLNYIKTKKV